MDIDLNLLQVFDTLMEVRSVTRAADRHGLTQSAVSHALRRLRDSLEDPLFLRGAGGLQPTARAIEIAPGVRDALKRLRDTLSPSNFEEAQARRRFTISAGPYFCMLLIPTLAERVRREAPSLSLHVVPVSDHLPAALDNGTVDLALGAFARVPGRFTVERLYDEEMVWIAAADNPVTRQPFNPEKMADLPRVGLSSRMSMDPPEASPRGDNLLHVMADNSAMLVNEGVVVYDSQTAVAIVARSDMVALVPRRIARRESMRVTILGTASSNTFPTIGMIWHVRQREDRGLGWLRSQIRIAADNP